MLVAAIGIGANIGIQKAKQQPQEQTDTGESTNTPKKERGAEYIPVVMRVSGEQGTRYRCTHSDVSADGEAVQEEEQGELGSSPVEYRARVRGGSTDPKEKSPGTNYYGFCSINSPDGRGQLKVELLVNGRVVDSDETRPEPPGQKSSSGSLADVSYLPQVGGPDPAKGRDKK